MPEIERLRSLNRRSPARYGSAPPPRSARSPRVLVVDDDAIDRMLARAKLDALGCSAEAVASGEAALEKLAAEAFDLLFMDCRMPRLDGYETTRALRLREDQGQVAHAGRLPVIAATAGPGYRDRCEAAGMSDVLVKPYSRDEIRIILERWLAGAMRRGDDAATPAPPRSGRL